MTDSYLDDAPCGYFSFADDGIMNSVNATLCSWLGYNKEELQGKNVEFIFTLPTRIFYQTHFFPLLKMQEHAEELFISLLTKDKQHLPVLLNAKRQQVGLKWFNTCAFIVVHNRKKFEDELVAARHAAEKALNENSALLLAKAELQKHAEKLDAHIVSINKQNDKLKQFSRVVSHDLQEPLRKILLYTGKLQGLPPQENNLEARTLGRLIRAADQMRKTVSGLQQFIWLNETPARFAPVDLNAVWKTAEKQLEEELGSNLLEIHSGQLPELTADAHQLQLLFYHIFSNAVKFKKKEKAPVFITTTLIRQNKFRALEEKYKYEDFVKLEIRDEGTGFDPLYKEDIFELFKRQHYTEGKGLGLSLCKIIVENHHGLISADSQLNEGTIITIVLPLHHYPKEK
jgi:phosphoserine phosphatase RsbU/P